MSGFQSPIEKDVFYFLMKGKQPIILVLAKGMIHDIPFKIKNSIDEERILIISLFNDEIKRVTGETALHRNRFMMEQAEEIFIPGLAPGGTLEKLVNQFHGKKIKIGFE